MLEDDSLWVGCRETVEIVAANKPGDAKKIIVGRCRKGLLDARAEIVTSQYFNMFETQWDGDWEKPFPQPLENTTGRLKLLEPEFWKHPFESAEPEMPHGPFGGESADWTIGEFSVWQMHFREEPEGDGWERHSAAGVSFNRRQLSAFVGTAVNLPGPESAVRRTVFDWEAAFADVAAALYHDVQFANLEAKGVQTELIRLLRSSFERRGVPIPSDDTLKPKARKLLGALRAKKP
ncbi:hypothetical protein OIK40_11185 [Erythrobacter sp. sf7]|uniref:Uncharacterized protein n=1 Tax=Erythrobacter fulvus TaxID=2987523 RepID=A0ABT5JUI2_9SPHN|nr:hypothetical protein [Erythrobacter fulvus]MDC8755202.1 hypothetical protein [Erythrobacter fulvus]